MDAATEVAAFFLPQEIDCFSKQQKGGWWLSIVISWLMFLSPKADLKESLRDIAFDLPGRFPIARWAPIPLRLIVGFGFMEHGFAKLSKGPDAFADILHELAVPAPHFMAWVSIMTELFGGLAILLGAFVSLISLPMAALLLVAIFTVHLPYGFSSIKLMAVTPSGAQFGPPGYECDLLYLACLVALVLGGSGPLAIDGFLRNRLGDHKCQANKHPSTLASAPQRPPRRRSMELVKNLPE